MSCFWMHSLPQSICGIPSGHADGILLLSGYADLWNTVTVRLCRWVASLSGYAEWDHVMQMDTRCIVSLSQYRVTQIDSVTIMLCRAMDSVNSYPIRLWRWIVLVSGYAHLWTVLLSVSGYAHLWTVLLSVSGCVHLWTVLLSVSGYVHLWTVLLSVSGYVLLWTVLLSVSGYADGH